MRNKLEITELESFRIRINPPLFLQKMEFVNKKKKPCNKRSLDGAVLLSSIADIPSSSLSSAVVPGGEDGSVWKTAASLHKELFKDFHESVQKFD